MTHAARARGRRAGVWSPARRAPASERQCGSPGRRRGRTCSHGDKRVRRRLTARPRLGLGTQRTCTARWRPCAASPARCVRRVCLATGAARRLVPGRRCSGAGARRCCLSRRGWLAAPASGSAVVREYLTSRSAAGLRGTRAAPFSPVGRCAHQTEAFARHGRFGHHGSTRAHCVHSHFVPAARLHPQRSRVAPSSRAPTFSAERSLRM